jgi:hypothetical protein
MTVCEMSNAPLDGNDLKANTEAMLALAAAINALVQRLPQPTGLGGYQAPLFTVECRCNCGQRSHQPFLPYAY